MADEKGIKDGKDETRFITPFATERIEDYVALSLALILVIIILISH